jgi:hypothetical protein
MVCQVFLKKTVSVLASWSNKVLTVETHFYSSNNDGQLSCLFEKKKGAYEMITKQNIYGKLME